jgi:modulator of FtsH protease HflK
MKVVSMAWDWEKLNQQQQSNKSSPPQMEELLKQFKNFKLPGGSVLIGVGVLLVIIAYSVVFTIDSGAVGVVQQFGDSTVWPLPASISNCPSGSRR